MRSTWPCTNFSDVFFHRDTLIDLAKLIIWHLRAERLAFVGCAKFGVLLAPLLVRWRQRWSSSIRSSRWDGRLFSGERSNFKVYVFGQIPRCCKPVKQQLKCVTFHTGARHGSVSFPVKQSCSFLEFLSNGCARQKGEKQKKRRFLRTATFSLKLLRLRNPLTILNRSSC